MVAVSDLRGQNGSAGRPELCLGEVNDVRALSKWMPGLYRTDPRRVASVGVSLGGGAALKAAALDPATRATAARVAPSDFAQEWRNICATRPDILAC